MKDKFAEIAAKETYRAKSIKGNVYNWNTTNQFMQQDSRYFTEGVKGAKTKNFVYCILILGSQFQWRITVFNIIMMERKSILTKYLYMIITMFIVI